MRLLKVKCRATFVRQRLWVRHHAEQQTDTVESSRHDERRLRGHESGHVASNQWAKGLAEPLRPLDDAHEAHTVVPAAVGGQVGDGCENCPIGDVDATKQVDEGNENECRSAPRAIDQQHAVHEDAL